VAFWIGGVSAILTLGSLENEENSVVNPKDPKNQAKTIHEGFSKAGI